MRAAVWMLGVGIVSCRPAPGPDTRAPVDDSSAPAPDTAGDGGETGDSGAPADTGAPEDTGDSGETGDTGAPAEPFPDPYADLGADPACEVRDGEAMPGATAWRVGDFSLDAGTVGGVEVEVLYVNATFAAQGGADCRIVWAVAGVQHEAADCATCAWGLDLDAALDRADTDCTLALVEVTDYGASYAVAVGADGSTVFYDPGGDVVGHGHADDTRATYTGDARCRWF